MRKKLILLAVLILAIVLRFWQLGKVPPSPDWDEAALGYNAYSIMKTGRDEYGKFLPLILRSFDDYKPAVYAYLVIPSIKLFGLNTFSVRFPSALLGTLTVLLVYYLVNELFCCFTIRGVHSDTSEEKLPFSINSPRKWSGLPLIAAFLLAISPWHIQFSRIAFESNVGVFFNVLAVLLFLKGLKRPWWLSLSAFFAGLNLYVYQAEKVFTPLLFLTIIFIWRRRLFKIPFRRLALAFAIGLMVVLPLVYMIFTTPNVFLRAKGTSFAADQTPFLSRTAEKLLRDYQHKDYLGVILDNRRIVYVKAFVAGYLSHFSPNWLFISGDDVRHHAPGMGLLYLWELPFFLLGIYSLIFGKIPFKFKALIFSWFFLAPVPAAFTSGVPHAIRTLNFLPTPQIFSALGVIAFINWIKNEINKKIFLYALYFIIYAVFSFNFAYYLNQYFVQLNYFTSQSWQYGYRDAIKEINEIQSKYKTIVVSNQPPLDQSYMFFLFYLQYDPRAYQQRGGTVSGGFAETHKGFLKYTFRPINWNEEKKNGDILYVGRPEDFPSEAKILKTIHYLNGRPAIELVEG